MESTMNRDELNTKIKQLSAAYLTTDDNNHSGKALEDLETILEQYLCEHPDDMEMLIRLAITVYLLADDLKAIDCLSQVPHNHSLYPKALLIKAHIIHGYRSIDEDIFNELMALTTPDQEINSMLRYLAAGYYFQTNQFLYQQLLEESVSLSTSYVWHQVNLGRIYLKTGKIALGQMVTMQGLLNIKKVGCGYTNDDITNIDEFIDSYIKGIDLTTPNFETIVEDLLRYTQKVPHDPSQTYH
jgi:hypothetical protein